MIMTFQELKSEEHVSNLVFCLNYFDYSHLVGRWVSGKWSVGRWSVVLTKLLLEIQARFQLFSFHKIKMSKQHRSFFL